MIGLGSDKNNKCLANTVFLKLLNNMFLSEANLVYIKIPEDLNLMKEIVWQLTEQCEVPYDLPRYCGSFEHPKTTFKIKRHCNLFGNGSFHAIPRHIIAEVFSFELGKPTRQAVGGLVINQNCFSFIFWSFMSTLHFSHSAEREDKM